MVAGENLPPGLYLVGTPIGNLEDITLRAIRVLKQADLIACEDTRQTQKLLDRYEVETPTVSYQEHNEAARAAELIERLSRGARIAMVSDAGMPAVSDPGFRLVRLAIERGVPVVPVPGPAAFVAAMVASGLPVDAFAFRGFLPPRQGARWKALEEIRHSRQTEIFYEAPQRVRETLEDAVGVLGPDRPVALARELTKVHEEFWRGSLAEVLDTVRKRGQVKGEVTLLVGPASGFAAPAPSVPLRERIEEIMREDQVEEKAALKKAAKERGVSKSEIYRELQLEKRQCAKK
jgi:16S rRNA (cytidine1402-2'-O)-methyltransferase